MMKDVIKKALRRFGVSVHRADFEEVMNSQYVHADQWAFDVLFCSHFGREMGDDLEYLMKNSKAQLRQDIFALVSLGFKRGGFFVEFGAADGITLSNTHLLEKSYGYSGILAEPSPRQRGKISSIRSAVVEDRCVWGRTGEVLQFVEAGHFSTISSFRGGDHHEGTRQDGSVYSVTTISLTDMLRKHGAPRDIDYLSIDTEGSEYDILAAHDFDNYSFRVITCEHNFTDNRQKVFDLLTGLGYKRKFEGISKFDDWYVRY